MVFAEENTESVTGVKGIVSDMSLVELRRLDAGYSFTVDGQAYPHRGKNVRIPTLEMVLTAYPTAYFYVNIKDRGEDAARDVLAVLMPPAPVTESSWSAMTVPRYAISVRWLPKCRRDLLKTRSDAFLSWFAWVWECLPGAGTLSADAAPPGV